VKLKLKEGVVFEPTREMVEALPTVMEAYKIFAPLVKDLVITSGNDGVHMQGSKHYTGDGLDFRTMGVKPQARWAIVRYLSSELVGFDCIDEKNHIHVEYDPD
tara:strand:- start:147 stop:455 length:309 start_codon:yes stop_codon:yes gene_type:complete